MEPGGLWWTNVLNSALPPQRHRPDTRLEHHDPVSHMALLGSLRSSASIQQGFCRSCSTCRCISDVFVGRKAISMSHSSTILKVSPQQENF